MVKFRFSEPFDFSPGALHGQVTIAYRAGRTYQVTRECAAKAEAAGAGRKVAVPQARRAGKKARA